MAVEKNDVNFSEFRKQIRMLQLLLFCVSVCWGISTLWLAMRPAKLPAVLVAERLDIVEPDGQKSFVLANSRRPAIATINGEILMSDQEQDRLGQPTFIFFDGKGDEVGGLTVGNGIGQDDIEASRHLSLDAYQQDQTIVLEHFQDNTGTHSGLTLIDRPQFSLVEGMRELGVTKGVDKA